MRQIQKWHIYRANLDPVIGSEQGKSHPVLVISETPINDVLNCVNIIPLSSQKPERRFVYPNEVLLPTGAAGLPNASIALCHQIRTIDKRRISLEYGEITDASIREAVFEAIAFQFGLPKL